MGYNKRNDEINAITKESIAFAYYELLQSEKSISVTLICEKAGVSRNAYYRNFNSTDEIIIYCLISKWAKYCEVNPVPPDDGEVLKQRLIQFFYSEKEFIRAIKKHNKIYSNRMPFSRNFRSNLMKEEVSRLIREVSRVRIVPMS